MNPRKGKRKASKSQDKQKTPTKRRHRSGPSRLRNVPNVNFGTSEEDDEVIMRVPESEDVVTFLKKEQW